MRILYLTEFLSSLGGGGEVAFYDIAKQIAKRGHSVNIVCYEHAPKSGMDLGKISHDTGFIGTIHEIKPKVGLTHGRFPSLLQQGKYIVNALIKGAQLIRNGKIDVIHANTICPAIAGSMLGIFFNVPVVVTVHHVYTLRRQNYFAIKEYSKMSRFWSWFSSIPKFICEKFIVSLPVDVIHTVSEASKRDLVQFGARQQISVIPNGIDASKYGIYSSKSEHDKIVLFIGRLVEYKNLDVVLAAFSFIAKVNPSAKLVIVGDGPARKTWELLAELIGISDKVEFVGYVSDEKKSELLQICSVLVFPSLIEGFGLAILEGFAAGKPVLVSDIEPSNEIVRSGVDGFALPPLAAEAWARKILFLLENEAICKAIGINAKNRAVNDFHIYKTIDQFEALYRRLTREHQTKSSSIHIWNLPRIASSQAGK